MRIRCFLSLDLEAFECTQFILGTSEGTVSNAHVSKSYKREQDRRFIRNWDQILNMQLRQSI